MFGSRAYFFLAVFFCVGGLDAFAHLQEPPVVLKVKGFVYDEGRAPFPGVSITFSLPTADGSYQHFAGAISGIEGDYSLNISVDSTSLPAGVDLSRAKREGRMSFNFLGYRIKSYTLEELLKKQKKGRPLVLNHAMEVESKELEEVVVTGFKNINKRLFPGATASISGEDVKQAGTANVDEMLQGKVSGVSVQNISGAPGGRTRIRIRGTASISGNAEPLWVIDGVVLADPVRINPNDLYSGDPNTLLSSAIGGINPNDIDTITVLKDATATAIYGPRAVNGVIIVTTKRGVAGRTTIDYTSNFISSIRPQADNFDYMNSKERMDFSLDLYEKGVLNHNTLSNFSGGLGYLLGSYTDKEIDVNQFRQQLAATQTVNTDWFDVLFRNSFSQEQNVSLSTGGDFHTLFVSFSYFNQNASVITNDLERYTGAARASFQITRWWNLEMKIDANIRSATSFNVPDRIHRFGDYFGAYRSLNNPFIAAKTLSRAMYLRDSEGDLIYYKRAGEDFNVLEEMQETYVNVEGREMRGYLNANFDFTEHVRFTSLVSLRRTLTHEDGVVGEDSNIVRVFRENENTYYDPLEDDEDSTYSTLPFGGILSFDENQGSFFTFRNAFTWKPFVGDRHGIEFIVGSEVIQNVYDTYQTNGYGISLDKSYSVTTDVAALQAFAGNYFGINKVLERSLSYYAVLSYSLNKKYIFGVQARNDLSNNYGRSSNLRFAPNVSGGVTWVLKEEPFLQNNTFFSDLSLRVNGGVSGGVSGFFSPTLQTNFFRDRDVPGLYERHDRVEALAVSHPPNPDLRRERTTEVTSGLTAMIRNRAQVQLNYYYRYHDDLVGSTPVSYVTGFSRVNVNWGAMVNQGVELSLDTKNITNGFFNWGTILTANYNRNRVVRSNIRNSLGRVLDAGNTSTLAIEGYPINPIFATRYVGLNENGMPLFYDEDGNEVLQLDLNEPFTEGSKALQYVGSRIPILEGGITNNFSYKQLNFSFLFTYALSSYVRLEPFYRYSYGDIENINKLMTYRWQKEGDEDDTVIPAILSRNDVAALISEGTDLPYQFNNSGFMTASGNIFRLRNVSIGYDITRYIARRATFIRYVRLQLQGQNLLFFNTRKLGVQDPEIFSGTSLYKLPLSPAYTMGVKVGF